MSSQCYESLRQWAPGVLFAVNCIYFVLAFDVEPYLACVSRRDADRARRTGFWQGLRVYVVVAANLSLGDVSV